MIRISRVAAFVCLLGVLACGRSESPSPEKISDTLKDKDTTEVLKAAADDKYEPPADGRLTEAQVETYLKVRQREAEIAKVAREEAEAHAKKADEKGGKTLGGLSEAFKTMQSVADLATADIRAAQELGVNTAEYQWVKSTILGVSSADMSQQLASASNAMLDASYVELKKQYDSTTDPATKKALGEALAQYDQSKGELAKQAEGEKDPAYEYNKQLIAKHAGTIDALATELSKYSGESASDLDEQMSDIQKAAEAATAKSQKH